MSGQDDVRAAHDALDRIDAAQRTQADTPAPAAVPMSREQAARAQGRALLSHLEASRSKSVNFESKGWLR